MTLSMNKKLVLTLLGGSILAILLFIYQRPVITIPETDDSLEKISVVASFYPLAYFTEQIAQEHAEVALLTESGSDPHSFSLSPSQRIIAEQADFFLFNGAGLDPWAESLASDLTASSIVTLEMVDALPESLLHKAEEHEDEHEDEHGDEEEDEHAHGSIDPHFWLDLSIAQEMVIAIEKQLIAVDPDNAEYYESNALLLKDRLASIDKQFEEALSDCSLSSIVVAHDAYGYLSQRYGFETLAIAGLSPDAQPSARTLAELQTIAKRDGISHVFFETLANPKISEVFANDINATTLVLHPLEGLTQEQIDTGQDYFSLMQENQENLAIALQCK